MVVQISSVPLECDIVSYKFAGNANWFKIFYSLNVASIQKYKWLLCIELVLYAFVNILIPIVALLLVSI